MYCTIAWYICGVLETSGKYDCDSGVYISSFIDVNLANLNPWHGQSVSSSNFVVGVRLPGTSSTEFLGPGGYIPGAYPHSRILDMLTLDVESVECG